MLSQIGISRPVDIRQSADIMLWHKAAQALIDDSLVIPDVELFLLARWCNGYDRQNIANCCETSGLHISPIILSGPMLLHSLPQGALWIMQYHLHILFLIFVHKSPYRLMICTIARKNHLSWYGWLIIWKTSSKCRTTLLWFWTRLLIFLEESTQLFLLTTIVETQIYIYIPIY